MSKPVRHDVGDHGQSQLAFIVRSSIVGVRSTMYCQMLIDFDLDFDADFFVEAHGSGALRARIILTPRSSIISGGFTQITPNWFATSGSLIFDLESGADTS